MAVALRPNGGDLPAEESLEYDRQAGQRGTALKTLAKYLEVAAEAELIIFKASEIAQNCLCFTEEEGAPLPGSGPVFKIEVFIVLNLLLKDHICISVLFSISFCFL